MHSSNAEQAFHGSASEQCYGRCKFRDHEQLVDNTAQYCSLSNDQKNTYEDQVGHRPLRP